ncbi:MAG TPA: hypothetical protein VF559_03360 [Caulobacteraceae bacterium]|jgi:hypothetical protein
MRPEHSRVPEPEDARADRTVRAPQLAWALIAVIVILAFVGLAMLFSRS